MSTRCEICFSFKSLVEIYKLKCNHSFCRECLRNCVIYTSNIPAKCPQCSTNIEFKDVQSILSDSEMSDYVRKCTLKTKNERSNIFYCQTPDCTYSVEFVNSPKYIICKICKAVNCASCCAIHDDETCQQYQDRYSSQILAKNIQNKEIMNCLKCNTKLKKLSGCNWIKCPQCNLELCWILQTYRWGPNGRNDTSGGCKCGVDGIKCHPSCFSCTPHYS